MIIKSLKLCDFRQFYGEHDIYFGAGERNVTIILGANGNGKTGIFRAIMFVLYGDEVLEQDEGTKEIRLVNLDKLDENQNYPVKATVEMVFENEDKDYLIRRSITSIKTNNGIKSNVSPADVFENTISGDHKRIDENENEFVNRILQKDIREFFFFDAEKMQLLNNTKSSRNISKEVKNGIIRLLQIKSLDDAIKVLEGMISEKTKEISKKAKDIELEEKIVEKDTLENEIAILEEQLGTFNHDQGLAKDEIESIEIKLSENAELKEMMEKKEKEKELIGYKSKDYNQQKKGMHQLIIKASNYLAQDLLENNEVRFQDFQNKKTDKIPLELIEQSLENKKCAMCQTEIDQGSIQHFILEKIKNEYSYSNTTPIVTNILRVTDIQRRERDRFIDEVNKTLEGIVKAKEDVEKSEIKLRQLEDNIGEKAGNLDNLKRLKATLGEVKEKSEKLSQNIAKNSLEIEEKHRRLRVNEREIAELSSKFSDVKQESKIRQKLKDMKEILEEVSNDYTDEIVVTLAEEMTAVFWKLLDDKDKNIFDRVLIDTNFDIKLFDTMGINRVQDLSMGQGQIFTLSFIISLAKLASRGRQEISFPLFMDTPFGRLSGVNRDNLIKNVPELSHQWILLLTDTELTRVEQNAFNKYDRVGKIYELDNYNGKTKVIEKESVLDLKVRG